MDMESILAATQSLKAAGDIAKTFLTLRSDAERQTKVIELQSVILAAQGSALTAQSEQSAMLQRIRELEAEVARVKAWDETKQRYKLYQPWDGALVYALKKNSASSEPPHWICTKCYEDGRKSALQMRYESVGRKRYYFCPHCKTDIYVLRGDEFRPEYVE